jgi:hypothetical protein
MSDATLKPKHFRKVAKETALGVSLLTEWNVCVTTSRSVGLWRDAGVMGLNT